MLTLTTAVVAFVAGVSIPLLIERVAVLLADRIAYRLPPMAPVASPLPAMRETLDAATLAAEVESRRDDWQRCCFCDKDLAACDCFDLDAITEAEAESVLDLRTPSEREAVAAMEALDAKSIHSDWQDPRNPAAIATREADYIANKPSGDGWTLEDIDGDPTWIRPRCCDKPFCDGCE